MRLVQPIARLDRVVRRGEIASRVWKDALPSDLTRTRFHRSHQSQLQLMPAMFLQNADATKVSGILHARRRHNSGEADRQPLLNSEPPMFPIERRNGALSKNVRRWRSTSVSAISSSWPSTSRILYIR